MAVAAQAADLRVHVMDAAGASVDDAVFSLYPVVGGPALPKKAAVMDQRGLRFVPFVLPVQAGTSVTFPNSDNVRHHVYSFSPAKRFELRLYAGNHASAVVFDQPGIVTLGCNIHDWMVGYVYVLDTPYFAKTGADGIAHLTGLPAGTYVARLWQPRIDGATPIVVEQQLVVGEAPLQRDYHLQLHAPDQSNMPPANLEMGLGDRMHTHGA
ncbi:methylamine utilization protein [Rhodanobacter sp. C03]|nr:methylamine utilization protein [Rhodanobacter sp. C03]